jgi:hypothetical protein
MRDSGRTTLHAAGMDRHAGQRRGTINLKEREDYPFSLIQSLADQTCSSRSQASEGFIRRGLW